MPILGCQGQRRRTGAPRGIMLVISHSVARQEEEESFIKFEPPAAASKKLVRN